MITGEWQDLGLGGDSDSSHRILYFLGSNPGGR